MAAVTDFGTISPDKGIYGLYNDFLVRITRTGGTVYKLSYRIKCTVIADTSYTFERDVVPINEVSIVNPVEFLKDTFFKTQVIGLNGNVLDDSATVDIANFGCNRIEIEVGESYADSSNVPATFRGYDTSKEVTFYNGYENIKQSNTSTDYTNYLDPKWYDATEVKLNHTILNRKISVDIDDENKIFAPPVVELSDGTYSITAIYTDSYDSDGVLDNQDIEPYTPPTEIKGYVVFNLPKRSGVTLGQARNEYYFKYSSATESKFSEKISVTSYSCNQNDRYRLRWFNRYSAFEYLNLNGKFTESVTYKQGKEILTDGIDITATTFGKIKSPAKPELKEIGKNKEVTFSLYTNYINEEERNGLKEALESPNLILYDPENNIIPVISTDRNFKIASSKNGLIQYQLNFKSANRGKLINR